MEVEVSVNGENNIIRGGGDHSPKWGVTVMERKGHASVLVAPWWKIAPWWKTVSMEQNDRGVVDTARTGHLGLRVDLHPGDSLSLEEGKTGTVIRVRHLNS